MSSYENQCQEDARLAIIAELASQRDATLNAMSIARVVDTLGIRRTHLWVETQLLQLEQLGAVNLRRTELAGFGEVIVATLTRSGRDHVERRARIAGISAPADEV